MATEELIVHYPEGERATKLALAELALRLRRARAEALVPPR